jgi:hypothetical protein
MRIAVHLLVVLGTFGEVVMYGLASVRRPGTSLKRVDYGSKRAAKVRAEVLAGRQSEPAGEHLA